MLHCFTELHPKTTCHSSFRKILWLVLTDLWATKPQKPLFWPHECTLPPKHCLSLSSLTVVYCRQRLDSLIPCCLTGPPPWIRDRSDTHNLAPLCLGTPLSLAALCFTWLSQSVMPRHLWGGLPVHHRHHRGSWTGCFACRVARPTAWAGGDLHKVREKWKSGTRRKFKGRNGESGEWCREGRFDKTNISLWTRQDEKHRGTIISTIVFIIARSVSPS